MLDTAQGARERRGGFSIKSVDNTFYTSLHRDSMSDREARCQQRSLDNAPLRTSCIFQEVLVNSYRRTSTPAILERTKSLMKVVGVGI